MSALHKKGTAVGVEVRIRFYEELNDHLPAGTRKKERAVRFNRPTTVGAAIESLGVPPDEVDLILVNGASVGFDDLLKDGDRLSVYPIFERLDISGVTKVRQKPLIKLRPSK
jgi:sulfur carrier protein ThiS